MKIFGLTELITRLTADIYDLAKDEFKQIVSNQLLEYQNTLYNNSVYQKTLLTPNESVSINEFYIPLFIRPYHSYRRKSSERIATDNIEKLFNQSDNLIIFGYAGSGKSTLVKSFILSSVEKKYKYPILIELRNVDISSGRFTEFVFENIFKFQKLGITEEIIERLLFSGNFLFILDGFDEIKDNSKLVLGTSIKEFIKKFRRNNYIITSRHYEALNSFENFKSFEVCEFVDSERNLFIRRQIDVIKLKSELANEIIKELSKNKNYSINQYLNNPLLLSLFIITYITKKEIPLNKSEFYFNIFDSLFHRLDRLLKTDYVHEKTSGLSKEEFMNILASFSFFSFFKQQYEFTTHYFETTIEEIKKIRRIEFKTHDFLKDLILNINIIVEEGTFLKFPHRSLQEYFAAYFITRLDYNEKKDFYYNLIYRTNDTFFISILLELDYLNAIEYFIVPMIDSFIKDDEYNNHSKGVIGNLSETQIVDLIQNIFESNDHLKGLMEEFEKGTFDSVIIKDSYSELTDWKSYRATVFLKNFKAKGGLLKKNLIDYVTSMKLQDKKLIEMLKSSK